MKTRYKYYSLAFLEGIGVLTGELLGAKMLAPYFGASLFIWTVVIGVTLLSLALGYYWGGRQAANSASENRLFLLFGFAAFFLALMPITTPLFFQAFSGMNILPGVAFCTILLLGPPLIALGATSPILIQRITLKLEEAGQVAGNIYAISTFGGIITTFLLGFWIIPEWGIQAPSIVIAVGLLLIVNLLLKIESRWLRLGVSLLVMLPIGLMRISPSSEAISIVYEEEGILGQLRVIDVWQGEDQVRARKMLVNGIPQTSIAKGDFEARSFFNYVHMISTLASMKSPGARVLTCGMGGGSLLMEFAKLGFVADAVDIDGRQLDLAIRYFYLDPKAVNFYIDDARHFIATTRNRYDIIVLDLLVAEGQPEHLFSLEAFRLMREKLQADGLLLLNFQGHFAGPEGLAARSIFRTLQEAGFQTHAIPAKAGVVGDIVFIASPQKVPFDNIRPRRINSCCVEISHTDGIVDHPEKYIVSNPDLSDTYLLVDDRPILDMLRLKTILEFRRNKIQRLLHTP